MLSEKAKAKIDVVAEWVAQVIIWFISAGFMMWGWNTVAPHLNAPTFNYWEIFSIRMMLSSIVGIFNKNKK